MRFPWQKQDAPIKGDGEGDEIWDIETGEATPFLSDPEDAEGDLESVARELERQARKRP